MSIFQIPKDVLRTLISDYLLTDIFNILLTCKGFYELFDGDVKDNLFKKFCVLKSRSVYEKWGYILCDVCGVKYQRPFFENPLSNKARKKFEAKRNKHIKKWHNEIQMSLLKEKNIRCQVCNMNILKKGKHHEVCHECEVLNCLLYRKCKDCNTLTFRPRVNNEKTFYSFVDYEWKHWRHCKQYKMERITWENPFHMCQEEKINF